MKIFSIKSGFTLAEVMVCLTVICIIASVALPIINTKKPPSKRIMFKKAYSTVERVVYELVNDPDLYPDKDGCAGLDNTDKVTYNNMDFQGNTKFRNLFIQKTNANIDNGAVVTADGMSFRIPDTSFNANVSITIDVNGSDVGPNSNDSVGGNCDDNRDIFTVIIQPNGKITTNGACAQKYLKDVNFNEN